MLKIPGHGSFATDSRKRWASPVRCPGSAEGRTVPALRDACAFAFAVEPLRRPPHRNAMKGATAAVAVSAALLTGCSTFSPGGSDRSHPSSVAGYFSPPQAFPGPTWTREQKAVDTNQVNSIAGPEHCQWQQAVMMNLQWPPGSDARTSTLREYIRDPQGVIDSKFRAALQRPRSLPADAQDTGYRLGDLQLWLSPSHPDGAYLSVGKDIERWPRSDPTTECA